jgi:HEXXH motif-containing protein
MPPDVDVQIRSDITGLMREGQWLFHRLGAAFVAEMVSRAAQRLGDAGGPSAQVARERLAALPTYRLAALALKGVDKEAALAGEDGSSILFDGGPRESELPAFWHALLHSFNTNGYYPDSPPVHYCPPTAEHHRALDAALGLLKERLPASHAAMTGWVQRILVVQGALLSGSSPRFFGCILMPVERFKRPAAVLAADLVHELAHQELFLLNAYDRLVQPVGDDVWRFSIFAGVRRPTMGRLHAAHAIFRMLQAAHATRQGTLLLRGQLWKTSRTFRKGELTPLGEAIVHDAYRAAYWPRGQSWAR